MDLIGLSLKERVSQEVRDKGLDVDSYKKNFQKRQAKQELVYNESKRDSLRNIKEHKQKINDFPKIKEEKEKRIKELKETNKELQQTVVDLIADEIEANKLLMS